MDTPLEKIPGIGPKFQTRLKRIGLKKVEDIIFHFPHRYDDFSNIKSISEVKINAQNCILGKIREIKNSRTWKKKMILTQAIIEDKSGAIKAIWFNQPYLTNTLKKNDKVCLAGKVNLGKNEFYISSPAYEKVKTQNQGKESLIHTGRIIPRYPETEGLSSRWLRWVIKPVLEKFKNEIKEILPQELIKKHKLMTRSEAIWQIHFPDSMETARKAKERFSFEELFLIELSVLKERLKLNRKKAPALPLKLNIVKKFVDSLPFYLTNAQRKCAWQILKDLEKPRPMSRLLQGDVGSGKTIVAVIAILNTTAQGWQAAFMAPTEILAKQHFREVSKLLKPYKIRIALLTGKEDKIVSQKLENEILEISRNKLLEKTRKGEIDVLIGTHTLIQDKVKFKNLALCIIDEQHRFGVEQRARLVQNPKIPKEKILIPHLLSMTATPIPRSLALTIYGDLDLSILDEMPKGRKKIITRIIPPEKRKEAYDFIRKRVKNGEQAFVICPRIEGGNKNQTTENKSKEILTWDNVRAVKEEYEKLSKKIFPELKVAMLHGKMKTREKEKIMKNFKEKKIDILVSTSVVEVGIDIPKATIMMIEGAERFGLSQLHQFRGRVGRSDLQSYCFLFTDSPAKKTHQRLKALVGTKDGFELSEKDLEIRGPGTFYGIRQWGIPDLAMENLKNLSLVEKVRESAKGILNKDPELKKYPLLRERLKKFRSKIHLE